MICCSGANTIRRMCIDVSTNMENSVSNCEVLIVCSYPWPPLSHMWCTFNRPFVRTNLPTLRHHIHTFVTFFLFCAILLRFSDYFPSLIFATSLLNTFIWSLVNAFVENFVQFLPIKKDIRLDGDWNLSNILQLHEMARKIGCRSIWSMVAGQPQSLFVFTTNCRCSKYFEYRIPNIY